MDTLFNLPAHPFLVHIPIVLLPLAAVGVVMMAIKPAWYLRYRWATLAVGFVGTLGAILAAGAGEELEHRIVAVEGRAAAQSWEHHAELGDAARLGAIVFFVLLALYVLVPWWLGRSEPAADATSDAASVAARRQRTVRVTLAVLALLGAAVSVTTVIRAGHSGSKAVWEDYVSQSSGN